MAEASGSRTHRRQANLPPAGFEDREDHRTPCASGLNQIKRMVATVTNGRRRPKWLTEDSDRVAHSSPLLGLSGAPTCQAQLFPFCATLAHVSFRATVRLNTGLPGTESRSAQK